MKTMTARLLALLMCLFLVTGAPAVYADAVDADADVVEAQDTFTDATATPAVESTPYVPQSGIAEDVTLRCKAQTTEGKGSNLADRKPSTAWQTQSDNAQLRITIPAGKSVANLVIDWGAQPHKFTLTEFDKDQNTLSTRDQNDVFLSLTSVFPLNSATSRILLELPKGQSISELYIYTAGTLPESVKEWEAPATSPDLLILATRMGDEFLYMGGAIPYYQNAEGRSVQVAYVVDDGRQIKDEALNALWAAGMRNFPVFLDFPSKVVISSADALAGWGEDKTIQKMVELIREYKPEVIMTNAVKGEKGDGLRAAVAETIQKAVLAAADESQFAESVATHGAWQVKKLYLHLNEENPVTLDWSTTESALDGKTPLAVAESVYANYKSLAAFNPMVAGGEWDNSKFGLAYTSVGDDLNGNDIFENLGAATPVVNTGDDTLDPDVNWADEGANVDGDELQSAMDVLTPPTTSETPAPTEAAPTLAPTPVPTGLGIKDDLKPLKIFLIVLAVCALLVVIYMIAQFILKKKGLRLDLLGAMGIKFGKKSGKKSASSKNAGAAKPKRVEPQEDPEDDEPDDEDVEDDDTY